jgi:endonuclease YncB( thermonuclease family)
MPAMRALPFALSLLLLTGAAEPASRQAMVLSCYDGDTCRAASEILPGRDRIRLANADTPEIEGKCAGEMKLAIEARDYTRALVAGKVVTLTAIEPDKYDKRVDAYVRLPDGRGASDSAIVAVERRIISPNGVVLETMRREVQWRASL